MAKVVLKDFFATWCPPCKMQGPIIEELEKEYGKKVTFEKVNIDANQAEAEKFNVMAVPTLIILRDDKEFKRIVGLSNKEMLKELLTQAMK